MSFKKNSVLMGIFVFAISLVTLCAEKVLARRCVCDKETDSGRSWDPVRSITMEETAGGTEIVTSDMGPCADLNGTKIDEVWISGGSGICYSIGNCFNSLIDSFCYGYSGTIPYSIVTCDPVAPLPTPSRGRTVGVRLTNCRNYYVYPISDPSVISDPSDVPISYPGDLPSYSD